MVDFSRSRLSEGSHRAIATEAPHPSDDGVARPAGRSLTRRNFIVWYLAGLLTATVVAILAPILVYIYPPRGNAKSEKIAVTLDKPIDQLGNADGVKFESPPNTGFVMKDGGGDNSPGAIAFAGYAVKDEAGKLSVFAINCSHLGCSINLNAAAKRFECPCHGSMFHLDGSVLHGPAQFPLSHLTWKQGTSPAQIMIDGLNLQGIG